MLLFLVWQLTQFNWSNPRLEKWETARHVSYSFGNRTTPVVAVKCNLMCLQCSLTWLGCVDVWGVL